MILVGSSAGTVRALPLRFAVASSCCLLAFALLAAADGTPCQFKARDGTCYGRDIRDRFFYLAKNFTNLNHGSFGAVSKPVRARQEDLFLEQEAHPDDWFRKSYFDYIDRSRDLVSGLISADADDVVLVENASSAVNSILRTMALGRGDKVLRLSTAYGMVVNTLAYLAETVGIEIVTADVSFPVQGPDQMVNSVKVALEQHPDVKLCIFSHISSFPSVVEPLELLIEAVRSAPNPSPSAMILVDGAHAPGVLNLDVPSYGVDFYLGNLHKWMYAPKGTAFLWVSRARQGSTFPEPTVISSSGTDDFVGRYAYTGTRDYTGFAAISAAFEFQAFLGGAGRIYEYCHKLAVEAGHFLANAWGTSLLVPEDMSGFMVNVILPTNDEKAVVHMQDVLNSTYHIYMVCGKMRHYPGAYHNSSLGAPYKDAPRSNENALPHSSREALEGSASSAASFPTQNDSTTLYITRLSSQVYLDIDDFKPLASLVPRLLQEATVGRN